MVHRLIERVTGYTTEYVPGQIGIFSYAEQVSHGLQLQSILRTLLQL